MGFLERRQENINDIANCCSNELQHQRNSTNNNRKRTNHAYFKNLIESKWGEYILKKCVNATDDLVSKETI
jgi:hypothetical protein